MAGIGNLVDLLLFYTRERVLFNRMISSMGKNPLQVKSAIALWLTLEEIGYHQLIRNLHSSPNTTIELLFHQSLKCLELIQPNASAPPETENTPPMFTGLFDGPMSPSFFYCNREFIYKKYSRVMASVCGKIFDENAAMEVDESGSKPVVRKTGEGSGLRTMQGTVLNPDADEFRPQQTLEDARTMFLTFSKGHPLTKEEILHFFTSKWGEVVQDVVLEERLGGEDPQFGRVVFTSSLVIPKVLNGQPKAKFLVNRKHLWARIYVPRHRDRGKRRV